VERQDREPSPYAGKCYEARQAATNDGATLEQRFALAQCAFEAKNWNECSTVGQGVLDRWPERSDTQAIKELVKACNQVLDSHRNDRDFDNIQDEKDACPDQPELVNGFDDRDGCPEPLEMREGVGLVMGRKSGEVLRNYSESLREYSTMTLRIEVVVPGDLGGAKKRAEELRGFVERHGIDPSRLSAAGLDRFVPKNERADPYAEVWRHGDVVLVFTVREQP